MTGVQTCALPILIVFSLNNDSDITIGVRLEDYQGNDFKFDKMVLRYCGQDNSTGVETIEDKETSSIMIFDLQGKAKGRQREGKGKLLNEVGETVCHRI